MVDEQNAREDQATSVRAASPVRTTKPVRLMSLTPGRRHLAVDFA
jgi:hypothetical protein